MKVRYSLLISVLSFLTIFGAHSQSTVDIKHVIIDLAATNTSTYIEGSTTLYFTISELDETLELELVDELSVSTIYIDDVTANFKHADDLLTIDLPGTDLTPLHSVKVAYSGTPNPSDQTSKGISCKASSSWENQITWTLSEPFHAKKWWPAKQDLSDKIDSARIIITTEEHLQVGSNGLLKSATQIGAKVQYEWITHYPIAYYLLAFTVGEYVEYNNYAFPESLPDDSILIQNYIYDNPETLEYYQSQLDQIPEMVELFSTYFGLYPFYKEKYGHIMAPFSGGMEHQTMTTLGLFTFNLSAHELGHQWFGDHVTCGTWSDIWINEGFARFCEYLATEKLKSTQDYYTSVEDDILSVTGTEDGSVFVPTNEAENESRIFSSRLTYAKGGLLVNMIRHIINNDAVFFLTIKTYLNERGDSTATGDQFREILERETGISFEAFFNEWYYGEGHPVFDMTWYVDSQDSLNLQINQSTTDQIELFTTPLEFEITYQNDSTELFRVSQTKSLQTFKIAVSSEAKSLQFDPKGWLIKKLNSMEQLDENGNIILAITSSESLKIWPNPTQETLHFSEQLSEISIYDMSGKLVIKPSNKKMTKLQIKTLDAGNYILRATKNGETIQKQFIKK